MQKSKNNERVFVFVGVIRGLQFVKREYNELNTVGGYLGSGCMTQKRIKEIIMYKENGLFLLFYTFVESKAYSGCGALIVLGLLQISYLQIGHYKKIKY